ncbi:MAG: hypothetical protein GF346_10535 [Candidatus Eisenbacteria bacterium]|nr:hypothetical protein [Candidatus Latescibacterota bacterium]MBD3302873.1 hypothetical protein [Candidatus Eisenbacteria bacterium]
MMRGGRVIGCLVVIALMVGAGAADGASSRIKPSQSAGPLTIMIGSKKSSYHVATRAQPIVFRVKGPTAVRLLTRYLYDPVPDGAGEITYRLRAEVDGMSLLKQTEKAKKSNAARFEGESTGTLERTIMRLPSGDHRVRLYPEDEDARIAVRLFRGEGKKKLTWVSFAPTEHAGALRLHASDTEVTYYRFDEETPARVEVHGSMRMKIITRLDFGTATGYTQSYVVKVFLDGKAWKTFPLKSKASHVSTYPDMPEITPGRGRVIEFEIPDGEHEVTIQLDGTTAGGAALRIRVPKRELKVG